MHHLCLYGGFQAVGKGEGPGGQHGVAELHHAGESKSIHVLPRFGPAPAGAGLVGRAAAAVGVRSVMVMIMMIVVVFVRSAVVGTVRVAVVMPVGVPVGGHFGAAEQPSRFLRVQHGRAALVAVYERAADVFEPMGCHDRFHDFAVHAHGHIDGVVADDGGQCWLPRA